LSPLFDRAIKTTITVLGVGLCLYTLFAVNYSFLQPQSALAIFIGIGLVVCFLVFPIDPRWKDVRWLRYVDVALSITVGACCLYIFVQSEPWAVFQQFWPGGTSLGNRPSQETTLDVRIGLIGLILVLEATRRSIGWIVPALALVFVFHCYYCYFTKAHNEEQFIEVTGHPTGGAFTLSYGGEQTEPLAFDARTGDVQSALRGLSTIGGRNVSVSRQGNSWKVQFRQDFDAQNVPLIEADAGGLLGEHVALSVSEFTRGAPALLPRPPPWLLPHNGKNIRQLTSATFLQGGVFGPAARVMFAYVFLFVVFGSFLEMSGATQFIIDFSERVFGGSPGGPAKVSVLGAGLMGSLSGSAVANAVTTGSFTIPMMRNAGFKPEIAGGITAAAASGGALMPPVMGAGAYMMLEFVKRPPGQPEVTFLEIAKAALIPALLYYLSLLLIVHFYSLRIGTVTVKKKDEQRPLWTFEGLVFFGALSVLVSLLLLRFTPFKAVTGSLALILLLSALRPKLALGFYPRVFAISTFFVVLVLHQFTASLQDQLPASLSALSVFLADTWRHPDGHIAWRMVFDSLLNSSIMAMFGLLIFGLIHPIWRPEVTKAFTKSAKNGISLVAASACVGIIIGIVDTTPMAGDFGAAIKGLVETNRLLALIGIMSCSIILGMGVPSVVCYLLMASLMGALLGQLGVDPLAAHLFIFYFGMMSMVTPPVALAAYASASIAEAKIMPTALAAFRFSLVGFTLPFMFIYRPALLLMGPNGGPPVISSVVIAVIAAVAGVFVLAIGVTGYFKSQLRWWERVLAFVAAALLLAPDLGGRTSGIIVNLIGAFIFGAIAVSNWRRAKAITEHVKRAIKTRES
jgi:TRAP transporter 4TM/12TM fusion protein